MILIIWLGAVGWLVTQQHLRGRSQLLADAALRVPPGATYFTLSLGGQQVGFASNKVDTLPDTILVQDVMRLQIPALGTILAVEARTEAVLTRTLRLRSFKAALRGDAARFTARGTVSGDTLLLVEIESSDSRQTARVPLEREIVLPALLPLRLVFGGDPRVDKTYTITTFDPLLLRKRDVHVTITAESTLVVPDSAAFDSTTAMWVPARWDTLRAWRIVLDDGSVSLHAWIDELGQLIQASSPVGFTMQRTAFEIAFENLRRREVDAVQLAADLGDDVIRQTAIASHARLETGDLEQLRVRLGGVDLENFDLSGGRQTLRGDTLLIRRETARQLSPVPRFSPELEQQLAAYLQSDPLIQVDDTRIQAQARRIKGRERNPVRLAQRLNEWVHASLDKRITVSVPSAVDVLETRRGDCNEHTVLYVALARAAGLPSRPAAGLVYIDGRFYYHAWPEVYLNGWVAVDPTLGQFPADAAHLRFTIGGLARQVELIRLIGKLQLDVLTVDD